MEEDEDGIELEEFGLREVVFVERLLEAAQRIQQGINTRQANIAEKNNTTPRKDTSVWINSKGEPEKLELLQFNHLQNIYAKIIRDAPWREEYREPIKNELRRRRDLEKKEALMGTIAAIERAKKSGSLNTEAMAEQIVLIEKLSTGLTTIFDDLNDALQLMDDETLDDTFGIGGIKTSCTNLIGDVEKWRETSNATIVAAQQDVASKEIVDANNKNAGTKT